MTEADKLWTEPTEEEEEHCEKTIKRIGIAILIAVAVGLVAFKCFGVTLTTFENKAWDRSGNGNDGTIYGGVVLGDGSLYFKEYEDYINTGIDVVDDISLVVSGKLTIANASCRNGTRVGGNAYFYWGAYGSKWYYYIGTVVSNTTATDTDVHAFEINSTNFIVDGVVVYNIMGKSGAGTLFLGAKSVGDAFEHGAKDFIVYDYKVYTNGVLIQHFDFTRDSKPITVFDSQPSIVLDQSGNGNTGTVHSGVSQTKSGMSFDGTINGYINTTFNPHTVLKDQSFSFSFWTIGYGNEASGAIGILDMYFRYLGTTGTKIKPYIRLGIVYDYIGGACIESSEWQHVVWTYDSNAVLSTIYVNGDRKGTKDMTGLGSGWGDAPLTIGRRQSGNAIFNMTGSLDNPAMYNKVLTITDATNLYLAGRNAPKDAISTSNLVLFYDFERDSKPIALFDSQPDYVLDQSGNGNTGTVVGATMTTDGMSFDGVNDYVDYNPLDIFVTNKTWAIYIWGKFANLTSIIFNNNASSDIGIVIGKKTGSIRTAFRQDGYNKYLSKNDGTGIELIEYKCDGTNISLRVNGLDSNNAYTPNTSAVIGGRIGGGTDDADWIDGTVYKALIYSRCPSDIEGSNLYLAGRNAPADAISTNNLLLFYDFDYRSKTLRVE